MPLRIEHLYVVLGDDDRGRPGTAREALYSHGSTAKTGFLTLPTPEPSLLDLPAAFAAIQRGSSKLRETREAEVYELCDGDDVFANPVKAFLDALDVIIDEVQGDRITDTLEGASQIFSWIDDDEAQSYFEIQTVEEVRNEWHSFGMLVSSRPHPPRSPTSELTTTPPPAASERN